MKQVCKLVSIGGLATLAALGRGAALAQPPASTAATAEPSGAPPTLTLQEVPPNSPEATAPPARSQAFLQFGGNAALVQLPNPYTQDGPRPAVPAQATPPSPPQSAATTGNGLVKVSNAALAQLPNPYTQDGPAGPSGQMGPAQPPAPGMPEAAAPGAGQPGAPVAPEMGGAATPPGAAPTGAGAAGTEATTAGQGFGGGLGAGPGVFTMIGDMSAFGYQPTGSIHAAQTVGPPPLPGSRASAMLFPTVRSFKIAENQSPRPLDRFFFDFNYYNDLNAAINRRENVPLAALKAYRYLFGFEKTFNEGKGSFGLRFPINTLTGDSSIQGLGKTTTATGDLSVFAKYILEEDKRTGSLVSVGLLLTTPTGPHNFANANYLRSIHTIDFQPFLGYIWNFRRAYIHGFSSFDFPANYNDVSMIYNDIGIGYWLYRSPDPSRFLTAVAPTFEVHVNNPLNHRDVFNRFDIAGTPDVVNLTYGLNFEFNKRSLLTFALVTPVTSPKPFDSEALLLFNYRFGRSVMNPNVTPPLVSY